jgi:hypothetical protein
MVDGPHGAVLLFSPMFAACCKLRFSVFRMFHTNIVNVLYGCCKENYDVANVAYVSRACCKCVIWMLYFQWKIWMILSIWNRCCGGIFFFILIYFLCCNIDSQCCGCRIFMLQMLFLGVASCGLTVQTLTLRTSVRALATPSFTIL